MINVAFVVGNVGNAESRATANGTPVLNFSLAVEEYRKDAENYVTWISCALFGTRAESLAPYITKGRKLAVQGRLHEARWNTPEGEKRSKLTITVDEVAFFAGETANKERQEARQAVAATVQNAYPQAQVSEAYAQDDIPF